MIRQHNYVELRMIDHTDSGKGTKMVANPRNVSCVNRNWGDNENEMMEHYNFWAAIINHSMVIF